MGVFSIFTGRLGADAETVTTGSTTFISCRVAVDETFKKEPQTRWITVNGNMDSFKNLAKYLTKGKLVQVRGIERVTAYITKSGEAAVDTRVWADGIDFLPIGKQGEQQNQNEQSSNKDEQNSQMTTGGIKKETVNQDVPPTVTYDSDDDLPF